MEIKNMIKAHSVNSKEIIEAIVKRDLPKEASREGELPRYLKLPGIRKYQQHIYERFASVIKTPSFDYISKTKAGWLIIGDHRPEIAAKISLIIEQYGLGVGMMVLHAQQMNSQHILLEINVDNRLVNLAQPTERLYGSNGEQILYVPVRKFRKDVDKLAAMNMAKPKEFWNQSRIAKHKGDTSDCCFYCSSTEINPAEVVVAIEGVRLGLSRDYSLGFTFSPFGNPISVMHFLAWDYSENPLNMNRTPVTVSDLVKMTFQINTSIMGFFAGTGMTDYPIIDGISNGWAGNSIFHQHFQFFQPEYESPIKNKYLEIGKPILERDDTKILKLNWPTPVYKIMAHDSINVGLVGSDLAGIWRLQGKAKMVKDVPFFDGYVPEETNKIQTYTQNLYVMGNDFGKTAYILLRDRRRVSFKPANSEFINRTKGIRPVEKENIGVLEATGTMIVENEGDFGAMRDWEPGDISTQIRKMLTVICPERKEINKFERNIKGLFPE